MRDCECFESLRLQSQLKTHGSKTNKKADVFFIRDLLQMINKFAALLLIGMASPYQILDWYGGRHPCHTASGALDYDCNSHHFTRRSATTLCPTLYTVSHYWDTVYTSLAWVNLFAQQASDARLELAILGGVDEGVDAAVREHHHHGEVVEPGCVVDSVAEDAREGYDLIGRPADDVSAADHQ